VHDGSSVEAGGLKCFKKLYIFLFLFIFIFYFLFLFFQKKFSMGAGGLECSRAINQVFIYFKFFAWNISIPAEAWGIVQVPSTEHRDSLEHGGKEGSSRS
jgi:hypothetical protein